MKKAKKSNNSLPSDEELETLKRSILAADPFKDDMVINDLRTQIYKIIRKIKRFKKSQV